MSQQFSHFLMSCTMMIITAMMLVMPLVVGLVAPSDTVTEWSYLFSGIAVCQLVTILAFLALCNSKPRRWTSVGNVLRVTVIERL